ncbi:MAG: hypothetical protein JKX88_08210 [Marinicaulis sp.]|nr:hypothetical protein [Marinicaulis sp.]
MIKKRSRHSILIEANIQVSALKEIGWGNYKGIQYNTRLSFVVNGLHYIGVVVECDGVITPGKSGVVVFLTASDALLETDVDAGSIVELSGGSRTVATAEILSMKRVFVKHAPNEKCGYIIRELP